jgi:UDP-glucose:(heptosyl)LPS alpha-1,3-glucosyltransferase
VGLVFIVTRNWETVKIALIRKDFLLARGGGERYAVNLAATLAGVGHEVHVFASQWEEEAAKGLVMHRVPVCRASSALKNISFAYCCRKALKPGDFDIVHSLSQTYPQDVYRMGDGIHRHWLKVQTPHPFFRAVKSWTLRQGVILWLEGKTFHPRNYRMIICNSRLGAQHARRYYQVPETRLRVIYNGVDRERFHPGLREEHNASVRAKLRLPESAVVLLFVAGNFERKGLAVLIEALPLVLSSDPSAHLVVVGKGKEKSYRTMAGRAGVGERVRFTGESERISQYYGLGDIFVLPTRYDPFSNACLEALASGIPVITTRENGAAEIIKPGETGVALSPEVGREELAAGISSFLPRERRRESREKAVHSVRLFTIEENARQTLEVYDAVVREKRNGAMPPAGCRNEDTPSQY